jgi:ankyrin repeat protein
MKMNSGTFMMRFVVVLALLTCINLTISGQKSFFKAIKKGNLKVVSSYISKGIDPGATYAEILRDGVSNEEYTYSFSPLEYASWCNQIEVVKLLMADKEKIADYQNSLNKAFSSSISSENPELIRLLLDAGADVNARCQTCYGRAAVQIALEYSNFTLFNELVAKGARIDVSDNKGRTLLHSVATNGNISIAEELLKANLDINAPDEDGATPVLYAAANGNLQLFKLFEEKGADLEVKEKNGSDLLFNAVTGENDTLVSYLISKGFYVNNTNEDNLTPLLYACYINNMAIVRILVNAGADLNILSNDNESPLLLAIWNKNSEMARFILDAGAELIFDYKDLRRDVIKYIKDESFIKYFDEKFKNY